MQMAVTFVALFIVVYALSIYNSPRVVTVVVSLGVLYIIFEVLGEDGATE